MTSPQCKAWLCKIQNECRCYSDYCPPCASRSNALPAGLDKVLDILENEHVKSQKLHPTERFSLQFNESTREWDLTPTPEEK